MSRFMLTTQAVVPAALIALLAGGAHAQFVARTDPSPAARTDDGVARSFKIVVTTRDGSTTELHMENGEVVRVVLEGERVPLDRVRHNGGTVEVLGADGAVVHVFDLSSIPVPATRGAGSAFGVVAPTPPTHPTTPAVKIVRIDPDAADAAPPPVMLGINLSEPGRALRSHLGIGDAPAILIERVIEGLPASEAGLERHDVVVSINGSDGASDESLRSVLALAEPGDPIKLTVKRAGGTKTITVELAAYDPAKLGGPQVGQWAPLGEGDARVWVNPGADERSEFDIETLREWLGPMQAQAEKAQEKALEDAHRQMLELRGDRLFVRPAEEMGEQLHALQNELRARRPAIEQELEARLESMERRFDEVESRLGDQIERLGAGMERLAELMERTAERIEERADRDNP